MMPPPHHRWFCTSQLHGVYIWLKRPGVGVNDMHAAHERIVYERMKNQLAAAKGIDTQPLLPVSLAASRSEWLLQRANVTLLLS